MLPEPLVDPAVVDDPPPAAAVVELATVVAVVDAVVLELELEDPQARRFLSHKNTALGIRSVWFAVPDLALATKAYESIGLPKGPAFTDPALGALGQVFTAGLGEIWLLGPSSTDSKVAAFLTERGGPGIFGMTIEVASVAQAARVIGQGTGTSIATYDGQLGPSIRVAPELTHGVWLEFSHPRTGAGAGAGKDAGAGSQSH